MVLHCYCGRLSGVINDAAAIISLNNYNTDSCVTTNQIRPRPPDELFDKE